MNDDEYPEPITPRPGPPATCVREYRITYRDSVGDEFLVYADEISRYAIERQLTDAGYPVLVEEREIRTSAWTIAA